VLDLPDLTGQLARGQGEQDVGAQLGVDPRASSPVRSGRSST